VFPADDTDFMQAIEIRGNNGGVEDVETIFALAGENYFVPTELFALDDSTLYNYAREDSVHGRNDEMAQKIAAYYRSAGGSGPGLVVRIHTHPTGNPTPSKKDKKVGSRRKSVFDRYFDDYQFLLGIHALGEVCDPDRRYMRRPEQTEYNEISWRGENREHTLALYDADYDPRPVMLLSSEEVLQ
jgi:hypothetical protein